MNNDIRKLLNNIYSTLTDSQKGYRECADNTNDVVIKEKFASLSSKRQQMIDALEEEAQLIGEKTESSGTLLGAAHRLFVDLKSFITASDKASLIKEIERGENHLINDYKNALKHALPLDLETLLKYQLNEIEKDLQEVKKYYSTDETTTPANT